MFKHPILYAILYAILYELDVWYPQMFKYNAYLADKGIDGLSKIVL